MAESSDPIKETVCTSSACLVVVVPLRKDAQGFSSCLLLHFDEFIR